MNKLLIVCIAFLGLAACNQHDNTEKTLSSFANRDTITLSENSPILNNLQKEKVKLSTYSFELTTSGTVKAIPNNYALIAAPLSGRITKSFVRLGQEVSAGTPIFEISSPEYYETGKTYYQAKEEMDLARKSLKRQCDLLAKGVGVQRDFEETEVDFAIKKKSFENALASLKVFQVDTANLDLSHPLIVRSPIKGRVVENNIVIGQYLKEDSEPIATVAELSKVWVSAHVKEKDIRYINETAKVDIKLMSFPEKIIHGKIFHVNSLIDEETRSIQVLIECDNSDKTIKPGMYVTTKFYHNIENMKLIPLKAIFQMDDASYVFIQLSKTKFRKQKIEIITENGDSAVVKSGLNIDDEIIVNGGFYLLENN
ncbi:MAG: efflux RND transporter periplasmic adaptor subunit [Tenuifilaceae bacterium]|nr:efflux RND transporter periplasmic adaptor subunit [Tenuifilaceae bacterium]